MLSSAKRLRERQGKYGTPRHEYLQQLVTEYENAKDPLRTEEIVANLANFAYDPINYGAFEKLSIIALFLDIISLEESELCMRYAESKRYKSEHRQLLIEFSLAGICNCIPDPVLQHQFLELGGTDHIIQTIARLKCIACVENESCHYRQFLSALTICYFLLDSSAFADLTCMEIGVYNDTKDSDTILHIMRKLQMYTDVPIANIAYAFCMRYQELMESLPKGLN